MDFPPPASLTKAKRADLTHQKRQYSFFCPAALCLPTQRRPICMKQQFLSLLILFLLVQSCNRFSAEGTSKHKIVWQPSHQTDTGKDFSEAATCNGIVEAAMAAAPSLKEYKVWSLGNKQYHHADSGSNTKILHTSAVIDGKISGYAYELKNRIRNIRRFYFNTQ